jgi:hypothetical protein
VLGVLLGTMFVGLVTNLITLHRLSPATQLEIAKRRSLF